MINASRVALGIAAAMFFLGVALLERWPSAPPSPPPSAHVPPLERARAHFLEFPLQFEVNEGQSDARARFIARGPGYAVFLGRGEAVVALSPSSGDADAVPSAVRMQLRGARAEAPARGESPLQGTTNYFVGNDPSQWRTDLPTYARVHYDEVYDGIDLVYYGNQQQLEYDFVVAPGADPSQIALAFDRTDVHIDEHGDLVLSAGRSLRMRKPFVYQDAPDGRVVVEGRYAHRGDAVGFELGDYDRSRPLIIDPVLAYSTYMGGSGMDNGFDIAVGPTGGVYIAGITLSTNYPTVNPYQASSSPADILRTEAFVTRINPAGTAIEYSTYLGGNSRDLAHGLAVGPAGEIYLAGHTASTDFPVRNPLQAYGGGDYITGGDAFVTKLAPAGNALVYSTYVGGALQEFVRDLALDAAGSVYVTGVTRSNDFPLVNAVQPGFGSSTPSLDDAFVFKINPSGTALSYSTYLGGFDEDSGHAIAVDALGHAFVTGSTKSSNFPVQSPLQGTKSAGGADAFVVKLDATGSAFLYSTFLGGAGAGTGGGDEGNGIAVDALGRAYVAGWTAAGASFPSTGPSFGPVSTDDAFVARLSADGSSLELSRRLGGGGSERVEGVAVDSAGGIYIAGWTQSADFPTVAPLQPHFAGVTDAFVARLDAVDDSLTFSTYLGGATTDRANDIAVTATGAMHVTGSTSGADFPLVVPIQGANPAGSAVVFTIVTEMTAPAVSVVRPNASGERVYTGTPYYIEWAASDDGVLTSFDVEVSVDDGVTFVPVPGCTGLSGHVRTCTWPAPGPATTKGRVRVRAADASGKVTSDVSDSRVTILAGVAATTVTDPNTAVALVAGAPRLIKWSHNLGAQSWMRVEASRNGGSTWEVIAPSVKNSSSSSGSFSWAVTGPSTAQGIVRVSWRNGPVSDASNTPFSIVTPSISMSKPVAGANWGWETTQTVNWTTNLPKTERVNIWLSENGGASFPHLVAANLDASKGRADVSTPVLAASTDRARLKVEWARQPSVHAVSPADFRVAMAFVTVTRPDGPATPWTIGTTPTMNWVSNLGALENVKVELSLDGGATYPIVLLPSTRSDGSQKAPVIQPGWATMQARIRVAWLEQPLSYWDASNASFTIK